MTDPSTEIISTLDTLVAKLTEGSITPEAAASQAEALKEKHMQYWDGGELEAEFDILMSMATITRVPTTELDSFIKSIRNDLDKVKP